MSKSFSLCKEDFRKILTAFIYSLAAASITGLISVLALPESDLPIWLIPLVPMINAFLYGFRRWIEDNR